MSFMSLAVVQAIVSFQVLIKSGSKLLFTATRGLAYIHNVKILLPDTWVDVQADPVSGIAYEVRILVVFLNGELIILIMCLSIEA